MVCSSTTPALLVIGSLARLLPASNESLNLIGQVPSSTLLHLVRSLLIFAEAIRTNRFSLKHLRLEAALRLADYGVAEIFAGANIELSHETWPLSAASVSDTDWMTRTYFTQDMRLPEAEEHEDLE